MADVLIYILIGVLIGWNLPQPSWAKYIQDKLVAKVKGLFNRE